MSWPTDEQLPALHEWIAEAALAAMHGLAGGPSRPVGDAPQPGADGRALTEDDALAFTPSLRLATMRLDIPTELELVPDADRDNRFLLRGSPPTEWTRTSVRPVLHRIRVTIVHQETET